LGLEVQAIKRDLYTSPQRSKGDKKTPKSLARLRRWVIFDGLEVKR